MTTKMEPKSTKIASAGLPKMFQNHDTNKYKKLKRKQAPKRAPKSVQIGIGGQLDRENWES